MVKYHTLVFEKFIPQKVRQFSGFQPRYQGIRYMPYQPKIVEYSLFSPFFLPSLLPAVAAFWGRNGVA
ncbi:MAG: hypothetical protein D6730_10865 [Bacteroidetes bacterium]|nr:MAG: hypothetical protein D6730_10865 [Bacteroidota bacterium]